MNSKQEIAGYTRDSIAALRLMIRPGDAIRYKVMVKDQEGMRLFKEVIAPVQVTGVYPHLVQAVDEQGRTHTITYAEMLMDGYILRGRKRKPRKRKAKKRRKNHV